jgi:transposase
MANQLKMALIDTIWTLHQRKWSQRRIARELNINRETVARHLREAQPHSKPANAPLGSTTAADPSKPANAPLGSEPAPSDASSGLIAVAEAAARGRPSDCEPWRTVILSKLELGLSAQRIYQDLVTEHGFLSKYPSVRRFVRRLNHVQAWPFRRLEYPPGEEAQVDFGSGAAILTPEGRRRRTHVLRIVLSHSRKAYSEAVYRQSTEDFIRCLENAFWHFGGVPQRLVLDNLRAAVTKADWFDPDINPKVRSLAEHYGVALWPTRPYLPRHKGKVERGVDYVQENGLKGRTFASLEEHNRFLLHWEQTVADTRLHGTTRQQVGKVFAEVERAALQRLPGERFPFFHEGQRSVHRDGHVEVDKAYYSVPPEYLGRRLWVRWDARLVRIFNDRMEPIAAHVKQQPGRFGTKAQHIVSEKICAVERGAVWLLSQVRRLGPHSTRWAEAVIHNRGVEGVRVLQGLLSLAKRHGADPLEQACAIALSYESYRLKTVRTLIERQAPRQEPLAFMAEHAVIRPLSEYSQFVHSSFTKELSS